MRRPDVHFYQRSSCRSSRFSEKFRGDPAGQEACHDSASCSEPQTLAHFPRPFNYAPTYSSLSSKLIYSDRHKPRVSSDLFSDSVSNSKTKAKTMNAQTLSASRNILSTRRSAAGSTRMLLEHPSARLLSTTRTALRRRCFTVRAANETAAKEKEDAAAIKQVSVRSCGRHSWMPVRTRL